jgi:tRNA-uridine 2-sulfurtransferase
MAPVLASGAERRRIVCLLRFLLAIFDCMADQKNITVVVAMSGGVDSSVTAALLKEQGYNVIGVTMKTYDFDDVGGNVVNETSCCGLGAMNDARAVASQIGMPHYVVDFREAFGERVIGNFVDEYLRGRTPNPCIICNREIKWGELLRKAEALGGQFLATGHYARVRLDETRQRYVVSRSVNDAKDQSYALWGLSQTALSKTMFPLGHMTKTEVRDLARRFELRTAEKDESFEICFVADNSYERFLKERVPDLESRVSSGDIKMGNEVVGKHRGYPFYTIGQRRGIGSFGKPVYVTEIEKKTNTVHIGPLTDLMRNGLVARQINMVGLSSIPDGMSVHAKIRYKDDATLARVYSEGKDGIRVLFDKAKKAVTPGQSVVLYDGDDVVCGGVIEKALSS